MTSARDETLTWHPIRWLPQREQHLTKRKLLLWSPDDGPVIRNLVEFSPYTLVSCGAYSHYAVPAGPDQLHEDE
jgi:hypothetical protein